MEASTDETVPADSGRGAAIAVLVSVALHVVGLVGVRLGLGHERQRTVTVIDIEMAPIAPLAETLPPEEPEQRDETTKAPAEAAQDEAPELPPESEGAGLMDAGVPDAEPPDAAVDAGVPADARRKVDAAEMLAVEVADAGAGDGGDDGGGVGAVTAAETADGGLVATETADGGLLATGGSGDGDSDGGPGVGVGDGGTGSGEQVAEGGDGGVGDGGVIGGDPSGDPTARPSPGTAANLLSFFPHGHVVTVMVRLDRLRDTEWAERIEAILKPLPDYQALVGARTVRLTDIFDLMVVSSPEPQDATATTLVMRSRLTPPEFRDFIDEPDAPVAWTAVKGGVLGRRGRSARVFPGDQRVFLSWLPSLMVLTQPRDLGPLTIARTGDLDRPARPIDLPPWLARLGTISDQSGEPTGPAIMVTAGGMFGAELPLLGASGASIPAPEQATITLEVVPAGLIVRGNLRYADDTAAATADDAIARLRLELLDQYGSLPVLGGFPLLTVLRGLTVQRTGRRLAFASSASISDGRAILDLAATLIGAHFEEQQERHRQLQQQQRQRPPRPAPNPTPP